MALAGDHVLVKLDDSTGTLQKFITGDIISVDLPLTNDQHDVTGFGDAVHKFINGQMQAPVTIKGFLTTNTPNGTHTVIRGAHATGTQVTLIVVVGNNATPAAGDPRYTGEFFIESYTPMMETGKAVTFTAKLKPATGTAPSWGTASAGDVA